MYQCFKTMVRWKLSFGVALFILMYVLFCFTAIVYISRYEKPSYAIQSLQSSLRSREIHPHGNDKTIPNATFVDAISKDVDVFVTDRLNGRNKGLQDYVDTLNETCFCLKFPSDGPHHQRSPLKLCPEVPPGLVGKLHIHGNVTVVKVFNKTSLRLLRPGGSYKPRDCIARERVAIIIPYRDRERHLLVLLLHLHTVLQRQQLQYEIFVIEMAYPTQFNRGMLANVGFLTATEIQNFTCIIIHDVDLLPADDRNLYRCKSTPRHLSAKSSKFGYKLPYGHYFGGIVAFTPTQFIRINGFSNSYFGWGKEDDDLYKRVTNVKIRYQIERPPGDIGVYEELQHTHDKTNPDNPMKDDLHLKAENRFKIDGVNSVLYTRLALEFRPLYTWVLVNTSEALTMQRLQGMYARVKVKKDNAA